MTAKILPFKKKRDVLPEKAPYDKERLEQVYKEVALLDLYLKYVEEHHIHDIDLEHYSDWVKQNYPDVTL
jgi:hypothetical protein